MFLVVGTRKCLLLGGVILLFGRILIEYWLRGTTSLLMAMSDHTGLIPSIHEIMSYVVNVKRDSSRVNIEFSDLLHAVISTGPNPNPGFFYLGAWKKATPMRAYNSLKMLDEKIASCLVSGTEALQ